LSPLEESNDASAAFVRQIEALLRSEQLQRDRAEAAAMTQRQIDETLAAIRQAQDVILINMGTWLRNPTQACRERIVEAKLGHDRTIDYLLAQPEVAP